MTFGAACAEGASRYPSANADYQRILGAANIGLLKQAVELELAAARAECRPATVDTLPSARLDALVEIEKIESGMACLPGDAGTLCLPVQGGWAARVVADNAGVQGRTGRWGLKPGR